MHYIGVRPQGKLTFQHLIFLGPSSVVTPTINLNSVPGLYIFNGYPDDEGETFIAALLQPSKFCSDSGLALYYVKNMLLKTRC